MTTATAKKQAATTKTRAKTAGAAARVTVKTAEAAAASAERTARTVLADTWYATIGLGDTAVAFARTLPGKVEDLRVELPKAVRDAAGQAPRLVDRRLSSVRSEFDVLATRGRTIVEALQRNASARQAVEQARAVGQQLGAAGKNLRGALVTTGEVVEEVGDTVEDAVEGAGRAAERQQYEAMTVEELRDLAGRKNVPGRHGLNKAELVDALLKA